MKKKKQTWEKSFADSQKELSSLAEEALKEFEEGNEWRKFALDHFLKNYGDTEPAYTEADIRKPKPQFKKRKKVK